MLALPDALTLLMGFWTLLMTAGAPGALWRWSMKGLGTLTPQKESNK